jgi:hypothetical protein
MSSALLLLNGAVGEAGGSAWVCLTTELDWEKLTPDDDDDDDDVLTLQGPS